MDYMSTKETSQKWNISVRHVQRLLSSGQIAGAKKYGNSWMVPANARKPSLPISDCKAASSHNQAVTDVSYKFTGCYHMPKANSALLLSGFNDPSERRACKALLEYLRGEYDKAVQCFDEIDPTHPSKLNACFLSSAAAISSGNYEAFNKIDIFLKKISAGSNESNANYAKLLRLFLEIDTYGTTNVPDWVKNENFYNLPSDIKLFAEAHHLKYLQTIGQYDEMRITAKTLIMYTYEKDTFTEWDIYYRIFYAIACLALNQKEAAATAINNALRLAAPMELIGPFAEYFVPLSGILEECLSPYDGYFRRIEKNAEFIWNNWISFHNTFTKENLTTILSVREYQVAIQLARGASYKDITNNMNISLPTTKKIIGDIYDKLYVHNKKELKHFLMNI